MIDTNNDANDESQPPWKDNLQELLAILEHQIRDTSNHENIEEFLLGLEATNPNFHSYGFIQNVKEELEKHLGYLIDNAVDKHDTKYYDSTLVSHISGALLKSKEFHHVSKSILKSIHTASENIESAIHDNEFDFFTVVKSESKKNEFFVESSRSDCSTIAGVDYLFLPPEKYKNLAKDIDIHKSKETRIQGLSVLQQIPQTDLVTSDAWEPTRNGLLAALDDENEEINLKALRFVSRLFLAGSSIVVKEYFLLLVEDLIEHFNDSTSHVVNMDAGLDFGDKRNILLLRKFALLNKIQLELPSFWLRYSEKFVEEMIEMLMQLLEINPQPLSENFGERLLSPLHFLSLVDPQADWFKKWTHGFYSRSKVIKSLSFHPYILNSVMNSCIDFSQKNENYQKLQIQQVLDETGSYSCRDILYAYFLCSLNLLTHTMLFKDGRELLSIEAKENRHKDVNGLIVLLIKTIISTPSEFLSDAKSLLHPSNAIHEKFKLLSKSGRKACADLICSQEIVEELINAVRFLEVSDGEDHDNHQSILLDLLSLVSSHEKGRELFLLSTTSYKKSSLDVLCKILSKRLTNGQKVTNNLISLLSIFTYFQQTHTSLDLLHQYNLPKKLHIFLHDIKKHHKIKFEELRSTLDTDRSGMPQKMMQENALLKAAIHFENKSNEHLLLFASTPKGLLMLCQSDAINNCVFHFLGKYQGRSYNAPKFERLGNGILCNQLFLTVPSVIAVEKAGYVTYLLNKIFFLLEDYTNDSIKTKLTDIPEDLSHRGLNKLFLALTNLLSYYPALVKLLKNNTAVEHDRSRNKSLSKLNHIDDFVTYFLLLDSNQKMNLLSHPFQSHLFALNVFHVIVTSLDSALLMKSKYKLDEVLMTIQEESTIDDESDTVIIDPCTIKRNQILINLYYIGGPNERKFPSDVLQGNDDPYPWPFFYTLPPPNYYINTADICDDESKSPCECFDQLSSSAPIEKAISKDDAQKTLKMIQASFLNDVRNGKNISNSKNLLDLFGTCLKLYSFDDMHTLSSFTININKSGRKVSNKQEYSKCSEFDVNAMQLIVRYAMNLKLIEENSNLMKTMTDLIIRCRRWLHGMDNSIDIHAGFEWCFYLMVLMLQDNNVDEIWSVFESFFNSLHFIFMWNTVVYRKELKQDEAYSIHPLYSNVCHWIEHVTRIELAQIYAAFNLSGSPPSQISMQWLRQFFLNYLNWQEISRFICVLIVMGIDYQVYFCVAVLRHLKEDILTHAHKGDLIVFLKTQPIKHFRLSDHVNFMKELEVKYREIVLKDMNRFYMKN